MVPTNNCSVHLVVLTDFSSSYSFCEINSAKEGQQVPNANLNFLFFIKFLLVGTIRDQHQNLLLFTHSNMTQNKNLNV
jgi:hypothetical protein